jgi:hypothetical protein
MQDLDVVLGPGLVLAAVQLDFDEVVGKAGDNLADLVQYNVLHAHFAAGANGFADVFVFFVPHEPAPFFSLRLSSPKNRIIFLLTITE